MHPSLSSFPPTAQLLHSSPLSPSPPSPRVKLRWSSLTICFVAQNYDFQGTLMVHESVSQTPEFQEYLRQEATRDLHINMEAKILALQEVAAKNFAPHTSITHPRLLVLQMQDDHAPLQNRGFSLHPKL
ncbi:uncharacterized protein PGTG_02558 [Puccinia graminis f. sp. tritici CRL 75-36-700-3]|uniref:Uncharacterized protein n=1 Tax=Puccinia graminis f. sp. tritici (strain CRL 75-36-700-3 / race SCCL) TaxID=418459 RepID=E3JVP2_PUCGT|nr:uncharacterized protein PGTG_02558 [Puccinia graminis f. sp. tritici CRL 75-36-700-3]EFP76117.2 hypothetical protein PGTG_02558 [Puccinia graminis f. sp. tritici CRL 75-36-700-3]